jgi:hypothetical protein
VEQGFMPGFEGTGRGGTKKDKADNRLKRSPASF